MASRSRIQLEAWIKGIEISGKAVDIGGSQNPAKGRIGKLHAADITILDLPAPHEDSRTPDIAADIQKELPQAIECSLYDAAICLEVAEYWHDPATALKNIASLLKPNGTLYISFHWLYGLHNPKGEDCLRYTYTAIERLLRDAGMAIIDAEVKTISPDGRNRLEAFYLSEKMRLRYQDPTTYDEGYLIKATKL